MQSIFWTGYSNIERHAAITQLQAVIAGHADITDISMFSDVSLTFEIEIRESAIETLYNDLRQIIALDAYEPPETPGKKETVIFLNITFSKSTGNLTIAVPSVPG